MPQHNMHQMMLGSQFFVYCTCGWHQDTPLPTIHGAAAAWLHHKEVGWEQDEYGE